jgi:hypothetical protein
VPKRLISIEFATLLYALAYLPYVVITRMLATTADPSLGRPLTGLEILPAMMITGALATYAFMLWSGWAKGVNRVRLGGVSIPFATKWTFWSGVFTALILVTVPLSYTFENVSVPFMQLLMRGDLLIIAPIVDSLFGRRVRWWSWTALLLVGVAMLVNFQARGGLGLPPIAIATILLYTFGYFGRLYIMSKVSKNDDPATLRRFFSEEKIVAFPVALIAMGAIAAIGGTEQAREMAWGFTQIWSNPQLIYIAICGAMVCLTGVFSAIILLDGRENSFCVPLERTASILAGVAGSILLALWLGGKMPSTAEFFGAGVLIVALVILSLAPRSAARREMAKGAASE